MVRLAYNTPLSYITRFFLPIALFDLLCISGGILNICLHITTTSEVTLLEKRSPAKESDCEKVVGARSRKGNFESQTLLL